MKTFDLTANELRAAFILTRSALNGCGGDRPSYFEVDEYTWCYAESLIDAGWSKESAAGTFSSLAAKGFIDEAEKDEWAISHDGWNWLETIWDQGAPEADATTEAAPVATDEAPATDEAGSKKARVLALVCRPEGASINELHAITGWARKPRSATVRWIKQAGLTVRKEGKGDDLRIFAV